MPQLGKCPSQPFHTSPWMFMLLCPKWQICSAAYGIIEMHLFVLSLFPCSSSGTAVLCLLFDRYFTTSPNMRPPTCSAPSTTSSCESFCSRSSSSMVPACRDDQVCNRNYNIVFLEPN
ncbi:hypothetical protein VPH35_122123 [Triticum aestivum]